MYRISNLKKDNIEFRTFTVKQIVDRRWQAKVSQNHHHFKFWNILRKLYENIFSSSTPIWGNETVYIFADYEFILLYLKWRLHAHHKYMFHLRIFKCLFYKFQTDSEKKISDDTLNLGTYFSIQCNPVFHIIPYIANTEFHWIVSYWKHTVSVLKNVLNGLDHIKDTCTIVALLYLSN